MVTDAKSWKRAVKTHELELPSGNVCLARRPGVQAFISNGLIPNSLMEILVPLLDDSRKPQTDKLQDLDAKVEALQDSLFKDPQKIEDLVDTADRVAIYCVVEPVILPVPQDDEGNEAPALKDPEKLYVDEVDLEDKMFIFQWATGGLSDLKPFREATSGDVAAGLDQPSLPLSTE